MRGNVVFDAVIAYEQKNGGGKPSVTGFVNGAIWQANHAWAVADTVEGVCNALDGHFPVLVYHERTGSAAVVANADALCAALHREPDEAPRYTHALPVEYPE